MPVGGSRHYQGGGLGQIGIWACPSCGEDNTGPLEQGCVHCQAGVPRAAAPPPPTPPVPRVSERAPDDPTYVRQGDYATIWAEQHPGATIAEAYRAGVEEGLRVMRAHVKPPRQEPAMPPTIDARTYRTVVAALALFRDQVLIAVPEEVTTGEWLSAEEAITVIDQLQQLLESQREAVHV